MKGIHASFYFRVWDLTREIRENKNPAKISTYTVYDEIAYFDNDGQWDQFCTVPQLTIIFQVISITFDGHWDQFGTILHRTIEFLSYLNNDGHLD